MSTVLTESLAHLTKPEILAAVSGIIAVPRAEQYPRERLVGWVASQATLGDAIQNAVAQAVHSKQQRTGERTNERKRKRAEQQRQRRQARRLAQDETPTVPTCDRERYLDLPSAEDVKRLYAAFYDATGNAALAFATCAVCAREVSMKKDQVISTPLSDIPHPAKLSPHAPHPHHTLYNGMLLEPSGVTVVDGVQHANICHECMLSLSKSSVLPPALSLANDMWIGPVPWELRRLTFPEQLLIALIYPRVYVFKLFPKDKGFRPADDCLQRGMRGNVTSYALDVDGVSSMVQGNLMPRPGRLLSAILSITFVGQGRLPKQWLRNTFRVRRNAVQDALQWLQANNRKYFGDIQIDNDRLMQLPEDGVPVEIESIVRHNDDDTAIDAENGGYVPEEEAGDGEYYPSLHWAFAHHVYIGDSS